MDLGKELGKALKQSNKTQEELAEEIHCKQPVISKWTTGKAKIPQYMKGKVAQVVDNVKYYMEQKREATGNASAPYLDGNRIIRNIAAMRLLIDKQDEDLQEFLNKDFWYTNPDHLTEIEREDAKRFAQNYLFKTVLEENMIGVFCEDLGFSYKELYRTQYMKAKSRGLIQ